VYCILLWQALGFGKMCIQRWSRCSSSMLSVPVQMPRYICWWMESAAKKSMTEQLRCSGWQMQVRPLHFLFHTCAMANNIAGLHFIRKKDDIFCCIGAYWCTCLLSPLSTHVHVLCARFFRRLPVHFRDGPVSIDAGCKGSPFQGHQCFSQRAKAFAIHLPPFKYVNCAYCIFNSVVASFQAVSFQVQVSQQRNYF